MTTPAIGAAAPPEDGLHSLVEVLAERLSTADTVAAVKFGTGAPVNDPEREQKVIAAAQISGSSTAVPPERVEAVIRDQIEVGKAVQSTLLTVWRAVPGTAPSAPGDLTAVRERISVLTSSTVLELASNADELRSPTCATNLLRAVIDTNFARQADLVHAAALVAASRSLCEG